MLYNSSGINNLPADQGTLSTLFSYITGAWQDVIETLWQIATQNQRNTPSWYEYLLYIFMNYGTQNALNLEAVSVLYQAANPPTQSDVNTMSAALSNWYNLEGPVGASISSYLATTYATLRFGGYPTLPRIYVTLPASSVSFETAVPPPAGPN